MSKLLKSVEGFLEACRKASVCCKTTLQYSDDSFVVVGVRSACNTHWASIKITPKLEPVADDAKTALRDAFTHVRALTENEDARCVMMTAIKRVYDAASK